MINILETSRELNAIERYQMTVSPEITVMKDVPDGTSLAVTGWLTFEDVNEQTGEVKNLLSVITEEGKAYSCQSATFRRSMLDAMTAVGANENTPVIPIIKFSGKTKSGRDYVNCHLDINRYQQMYMSQG